jgi:hypothetical protein
MRVTLRLPEPIGEELRKPPDRDAFVSEAVAKALEGRRRAERSKSTSRPRTGRRLDPAEVSELKLPPITDRNRELAWRRAHQDELQGRFAGQWVVLEGEEVVAASEDAARDAPSVN